MGIPDEDIARVRAATDIVALIGEHAALKRQGRRWVGLCPFHGEKTPSFSVNAEEGFYYCFGCQAKGDAISFVRSTEHLDFVDAVRRLADKSGIVIHEDANTGRDSMRRKAFLDTMEQAVEWYHHRLLTGVDAGPARDYLRSRGYDGDVVRRFRLGWAPDDWDSLCAGLHLDESLAVGSGLGFVNRASRLQDSFRARILFPICDPSGHPIALGGRVLPGSTDPAKYKNSAENPIYSKRKTLYALNWAKGDIIASGEVVVCEGYTDVIGLFGVGVERSVATCGTALGDDHFRLLRNFAKRVVLAFDSDGAGLSAAGRFYEWERRHEVDVVVADLPAGADPGELARTDPDTLRRAISEAKPFLQFRVERLLAAADLSTAEGRAKAADTSLAAVAEHPDDLVRDQYVMQIAERCRLDPAPLRDRLERLRREGPRPQSPTRGSGRQVNGSPGGSQGNGAARRTTGGNEPADGPWVREPDDDGWDADGFTDGGSWPPDGAPAARPVGRSGSAGTFRPGLEALRLAIHRPEEVGRLESVLFRDELQRDAFLALMEADDLPQAIDASPPDVRSMLVRLVVEEPTGQADDVLLQLVRDAARQELAVVTREARSSAEARSEAAAASVWVQQLDNATAAATASDRLVAWLVGRGQRPDAVGEL